MISIDHGPIVKYMAPLSVSQVEAIFSFTLSIQHSLHLPLFLCPSYLACNALLGIWSTVNLSTCPKHWSLHSTTLSRRVVSSTSTECLSSSFIFCSF